jgi:hypothetical protein
MPHFPVQPLGAVLLALLISRPPLAFRTPLSAEAVREASFLGQHRDERMALFLLIRQAGPLTPAATMAVRFSPAPPSS